METATTPATPQSARAWDGIVEISPTFARSLAAAWAFRHQDEAAAKAHARYVDEVVSLLSAAADAEHNSGGSGAVIVPLMPRPSSVREAPTDAKPDAGTFQVRDWTDTRDGNTFRVVEDVTEQDGWRGVLPAVYVSAKECELGARVSPAELHRWCLLILSELEALPGIPSGAGRPASFDEHVDSAMQLVQGGAAQ